MKELIKLLLLLSLASCSSYPNQDLVGSTFPSISGTALDGKKWNLPKDFEGKATLLLIGYRHKSQFDIDRWFIGLDMKKVIIPTFELPTIKGMFPRMFSTMIDNGMKKGIPKPIWKGVITVYKDGAKIQEFTGNENPRSSRVILINNKGEILFFHDKGFSVPALNKLIKAYKDAG
jgi:hypothetical protein